MTELEHLAASIARDADRCDRCGEIIRVGDWPLCPHGRANLSTHPDDVPGGFWADNGFETPTWFPSHSAHEKALAERGMEIRAKNAGPADKFMTRWDTVDLEAAAQLVQRGSQAAKAKNDRAKLYAEFPITVTDVTYERP